MTENLKKLSLLLIIASLLVACGSAEDATPNDPADTERPTVESLSPSSIQNTKEIGFSDEAITFKLSEAIDESKLPILNAEEIRSSNNVLLDATWSFNRLTNDLILTFKTLPLPSDELFIISLNGELTDKAGNGLIYKLDFNTPTLFGINISVNGLDANESVTVTQSATDSNAGITSVDLSSEQPTAFINSKLNDGEAYVLSVSNLPENKFCALTSAYGKIESRNTAVNINCHDVLPYSANTAKWNDYYIDDATKPSLHGGEQRALNIPGLSSCDGITTTDNLEAFNWDCEAISDSDTTKIRVFSTSLKDTKGLTDLLNISSLPVWKENFITVKQNDQIIHSTEPAVWWNNPVLLTPESPQLSLESAIYVYTDTNGNLDNKKQSFNIQNRGIALVIDPAMELNTEAGGIIVNNSGTLNREEFWLEGAFDFKSDDKGIELNSTSYGRLNNLTVKNSKDVGINIFNSPLLQLSNITVTASKSSGIVIDNSSLDGFGIEVVNSYFANNGKSGIVINSDFSKLINVHAMNNQGYGIILNKGNNSISGAYVYNNLSDGIVINGTQNNLLSMITASNNQGYGIHLNINGVDDARKNNIHAVSVVNNKLSGIHFAEDMEQTNIDSNKLSNVFDAYNAISNCSVCENMTTLTSTDVTPSDVFVSVTTDSMLTDYDATNGVANTEINRYIKLDNPYRSWGNINSPSDSQGSGSCLVDGEFRCIIRDTSLLNTDTFVFNMLDEPNKEIEFTYIGGNTITYLNNSLEINIDNIGNNNGFCEANETCVRLSNIGSYQGHDALTDYTGTNDIWTALGITLKQYQNNGY